MYCSINDILKDIDEAELIRLADDENRGEAVDLSDANEPAVIRINEQINAADDEIDGYLRAAYSLPFDKTPERIKQISKDISIYNLYKRRYRMDMPESVNQIYKQRLDELKAIGSGKILLDITQTEANEQPSQFHSNKTDADKIFTKDLLGKF